MPDAQQPLLSPRGIRNNNPGNIRLSETFKWRGQIGADKDGFCIFIAPVWGIRAIARTWITYHEDHGCENLRDYIGRWAPPTENDTTAYIMHVAKSLDVDPNKALDIHALACPIIAAIIRYENGEQPYTLDQIRRGITLSHER